MSYTENLLRNRRSNRHRAGKLVARTGKFAENVHKLKAKDSTGRWAYYFVYVPKIKERLFLEALRSKKTVQLTDYGEVLASNYGESPSADVLDTLESKYGWDLSECRAEVKDGKK